jgi:hypothetical protein
VPKLKAVDAPAETPGGVPTDHRREAVRALREVEDPGSAAIVHALLWVGELLAELGDILRAANQPHR